MLILFLNILSTGAMVKKAPYMTAEALHSWKLYKSGFNRDIYFRQDRLGVAVLSECDTLDRAVEVVAKFTRAKA